MKAFLIANFSAGAGNPNEKFIHETTGRGTIDVIVALNLQALL